jgi:hypothetical protein
MYTTEQTDLKKKQQTVVFTASDEMRQVLPFLLERVFMSVLERTAEDRKVLSLFKLFYYVLHNNFQGKLVQSIISWTCAQGPPTPPGDREPDRHPQQRRGIQVS